MKPSHDRAATLSADKSKTHCCCYSQVWEEGQECAPCSDGVLFCMSCTLVICPCCIATPFMLSAQAVLTTAAVTVTGSSFTSRDQRQQHPMQGWPAQMRLHRSDLKKVHHLLRQPQVVVAVGLGLLQEALSWTSGQIRCCTWIKSLLTMSGIC